MSWLADGREGRPTDFEDLADLVEQALVTLETLDAAHCMPEDLCDESDCEGWIPAVSDGDCPRCGREIWLDEAPIHPWSTLRIEREAIVNRLEGVLRQIGSTRRLREGVAFAVEADPDEVLVVVADWSDGTRWMADRTLRGRPFVLVQVDELRTAFQLGEEPWMVAVRLVDVLRDPRVLAKAVRQACDDADLDRRGPAIVELHRLVSRPVHVHFGARVFELGSDCARLDEIEVAASPVMVEALGFLVDRHLEDREDGKAPDAFCSFTLEDVATELGRPRHRVQKELHRFRTRMERLYLEQASRPLPANSVIELTDGGTWRISASCLVRRSA